MPYLNETHGIAYYPVHKCANTTMKYALYDLEACRDTVEVGAGLSKPDAGNTAEIHLQFPAEITYKFVPLPEGDRARYFKFAIVRDPVARIVSMFQDKIVRGKEYDRPRMLKRLAEFSLPAIPTLTEFLENFEIYRSCSQTVKKHSWPLAWHLGRDAGYYDRIYSMSEVSRALHDLSDRTKVPLRAVAANSAVTSARVTPTDREVGLIERLFKADYAQYGRHFA